MKSHLDIANSWIVGEAAALVAPHKSKVLFSGSPVRSPHCRGGVYELHIVVPDNPLQAGWQETPA